MNIEKPTYYWIPFLIIGLVYYFSLGYLYFRHTLFSFSYPNTAEWIQIFLCVIGANALFLYLGLKTSFSKVKVAFIILLILGVFISGGLLYDNIEKRNFVPDPNVRFSGMFHSITPKGFTALFFLFHYLPFLFFKLGSNRKT